MRSPKRYWPLLFWGIILITWLVLHFSPAAVYARKYNDLAPGLTAEGVVTALGREPDAQCIFGKCRILYYFDLTFFGDPNVEGGYSVGDEHYLSSPKNMPSVVGSKDAIPYVYGARGILLGPDGRVRAYGVIGEGPFHGANGDIDCGHFTQLDNSYFQ